MLLRIGEVAKLIDRNPLTIKHWYEWQDEFGVNAQLGELPPMYRKGAKGVRHFEHTDIPKLVKFRDNLKMNPGIMAEYNRRNKGEKGKLAQERIDFKNEIKKLKEKIG